jgi:hypothetical protein
MRSQMKHRQNHRHHTASATVSIHVHDQAQLFNSLDPSPFWDRDLDRDAATFIEEEFADKRNADAWHLHVHVQEGVAVSEHLQQAVESYYRRLANTARRELHEHLKLGQLALAGGIAIFLLSMGLRQILQSMVSLPHILDEGLIILAWLALWRPTEVLVYEWVPYYRKRRLYERLAKIRVAMRSATSNYRKQAASAVA